jgi:dTMP kinase
LAGIKQTGNAADKSTAGHFITFEGGEGAGKTTQIRRLAARLRHAGYRVVVTREPGGTNHAEAIRRLLLTGAARALGPEAEAILFAAARRDHVERLIAPELDAGGWVLCDRFLDSTRAYQGAAGLDDAKIVALEGAAIGDKCPELTIILDLPVKLGMDRAKGRSALDRFEQDGMAEHMRRREIFLAIAEQEPQRCRLIDATEGVETVAAAVWSTVRHRFAEFGADRDG